MNEDTPSFVALIRQRFTPIRIATTWLGEERTLDEGTRDTLAAIVGAKGRRIRAGKKIIDSSHELYLACTSIRSQAKAALKRNSRPFEGAIRLVVNEDVEEVHRQILAFGARLEAAAMQVQLHFDEIVNRDELGELYDSEDYQRFRANVAAEFSLRPVYPSLDAPAGLALVSEAAASYAVQRANARIQASLVTAEQEFISEFEGLVSHFIQMMGFDENGNPRRFQQATLDNLNQFFETFRRFDIGSLPRLNAAVDEAQRALGDTTYAQLKGSDRLRRVLADEMGQVRQQLSALVVAGDNSRAFELEV